MAAVVTRGSKVHRQKAQQISTLRAESRPARRTMPRQSASVMRVATGRRNNDLARITAASV